MYTRKEVQAILQYKRQCSEDSDEDDDERLFTMDQILAILRFIRNRSEADEDSGDNDG